MLKQHCSGGAVQESLLMASHKLATILRSTGQLSDEEIENMSEEEAWEWLRSNTSISEDVSDASCSADDTGKLIEI
jgi:hypothetical protein